MSNSMTPERAIEALKELEWLKDNYGMSDGFLSEDTIKMAISALEYRIPKKPLTETVNRGIDVSGEYDIDYNYLCPNCNAVVGDFETEDIWCDFCDSCGQAIDKSLDRSDEE